MKFNLNNTEIISPNMCRTCINKRDENQLTDIFHPNILMKLKECTNLQVSIVAKKY